ncbi:MAG: flagellar export protein FliJ [Sulfurospirillaceae bacterium]|nr:flagellar export protein FliJ [Sulfurospirillaceae bacterium]
MKSAFSQISKVKKQKLNKIENELARIRLDILEIETGIHEIYVSIKKLTVPKHGAVNILASYQEQRRILNVEKKHLEQNLEAKNIELSKKQFEYKNAQIDFEKIKYLEEQELMQKIDKLNKEEQKNMDEISNILQYKRSKV